MFLSWYCIWTFDISVPFWMEFWTQEGHQLNCNGRPGNFVHIESPLLETKLPNLYCNFLFHSCNKIPYRKQNTMCRNFQIRLKWKYKFYTAGISFPLVPSNLSNWWIKLGKKIEVLLGNMCSCNHSTLIFDVLQKYSSIFPLTQV